MNKEAAAVKLARDLGIDAVHSWGKPTPGVELIERFHQLAVAAEREACAQEAEAHASIEGIGQRIAAAIRARGNT